MKAARRPVPPHVYVYGVVAGRLPARALAGLPSLPDGAAPRTVALDDTMRIIVADVPAAVYNAASLAPHLTDLEWVGRCGAAHHAVADALAQTHAVLPFRLFTLFSSEARALATLRRSQPRLARALARVAGRHEWVLRIGRPLPPAGGPRAANREPAATSGAEFLRAKAGARRALGDRNARVADEAARVFDALRQLSDASAARPIPAGTSLLLDAAFLVPKRRTAALRRTLTQSAAMLLREGCPVSLTGPWPAYSFASLESGRAR